MTSVTVYTTDYCPYCDAAKAFLDQKGIPYEEVSVNEPEAKMALKQRTGWMTVPQIFFGDELIGGYQELVALEHSGELNEKLSAT